MKKIISACLMLILTTVPCLAADKAAFQVGSVTLKSTSSGGNDSVAAVNQGSLLVITIGGTKGASAGVLSILIPSSEIANFTKGYKLDLTGSGNDGESDNEGLVTFLVTKIKVNGFNSSTTSYATSDDSVGTGSITIASYDAETKTLKFNLNGKINPYIVSQGQVGETPDTNTVNKPITVKATVIVTLP